MASFILPKSVCTHPGQTERNTTFEYSTEKTLDNMFRADFEHLYDVDVALLVMSTLPKLELMFRTFGVSVAEKLVSL